MHFFIELPLPSTKMNLDALCRAQCNKNAALLNWLEIKPNDKVLEIGCGWASLAIYASQRYTCKWTGLTISREQQKWANERIQQTELRERIQIKLQDYR